MKFTLQGGKLMEPIYIGEKAPEGSWLDYLNKWADGTVQAEKDYIAHPILSWIGKNISEFWHDWFIPNLPEIAGYGTILAGICIVLGSAVGKGGMIKPLAVWAILMIVAVCILSSKGV